MVAQATFYAIPGLDCQHVLPLQRTDEMIFFPFHTVKTAEIGAKIIKINKMAKNHFSRSDLGS